MFRDDSYAFLTDRYKMSSAALALSQICIKCIGLKL